MPTNLPPGWIDLYTSCLLPKPGQSPLTTFSPDFRKCRATKRTLFGDFSYGFLHLEADGIFEWGLQEGLIAPNQQRLLLEAKEEAARRDWIKRLRKRFIEQGIPPEKWPSILRKAYAEPDETVKPPFAHRSGGETLGKKLREAFRQKNDTGP